ncbi:MAG: arginine--tRNA ligase, partial [Candidatus Cloacimonetes bacterium]|nr:arginine--tRNA ligase [Candidatus Cloacimonadota bacterium]
CAEHREPHRLAGYVHDLAGVFHRYYAKYKIIDEAHKELSLSRLYLISAIKSVVAISLNLMGISAPEKM